MDQGVTLHRSVQRVKYGMAQALSTSYRNSSQAPLSNIFFPVSWEKCLSTGTASDPERTGSCEHFTNVWPRLCEIKQRIKIRTRRQKEETNLTLAYVSSSSAAIHTTSAKVGTGGTSFK